MVDKFKLPVWVWRTVLRGSWQATYALILLVTAGQELAHMAIKRTISMLELSGLGGI
jgi:hypothetical protein